MSMKTILVPTEPHDAMRAALATAVALARRFDGYIEGFALRYRVDDFVAVDMAGAIPFESLREESLDEARRARALFEAFMQDNGVPGTDRGPPGRPGLSYGWLADAPEGEAFVGGHGRVFDCIVMSRSEASSAALRDKAIESALFESGRPVLISPPMPAPTSPSPPPPTPPASAPPTSRRPPVSSPSPSSSPSLSPPSPSPPPPSSPPFPTRIATNILVAWNGSTEQARATAFAMPLLHGAERVTVLHVEGGTAVAGPSAAQLVQNLRRNGIVASRMTVGLDGRGTGEAILAAAQALGCDLLIKGAYTQSRLRQMIFGGATRHILANAQLPVLMAN